MRRFSQRNSLVTLNEINITPLLDLAFVLLIIFVITRPLLEQSMDLNLPQVGKIKGPHKIENKDIAMVEISPNGIMRLRGTAMTLPRIEAELVNSYNKNKDLVVVIRADKRTAWDNGVAVLNACMKHDITRVSVQTAPEK